MLVDAVVITRDRAGANVDARPNFGIADVGQVIDLAAISNRALFYLNKVSDLDVIGECRARAQTCEWSALAVVTARGSFDVAIGVNHRADAKLTVANQVV